MLQYFSGGLYCIMFHQTKNERDMSVELKSLYSTTSLYQQFAEIQYKYSSVHYNSVNTMFIHVMYSSLLRRAALLCLKVLGLYSTVEE